MRTITIVIEENLMLTLEDEKGRLQECDNYWRF